MKMKERHEAESDGLYMIYLIASRAHVLQIMTTFFF